MQSILSAFLTMFVVQLKRMWTSYHTKNLIMNNSRQKTEMRYNLEELKLKLKQLEEELESVKIENKSLRQDNYKLNHPVFDVTKYKKDSN